MLQLMRVPSPHELSLNPEAIFCHWAEVGSVSGKAGSPSLRGSDLQHCWALGLCRGGVPLGSLRLQTEA